MGTPEWPGRYSLRLFKHKLMPRPLCHRGNLPQIHLLTSVKMAVEDDDILLRAQLKYKEMLDAGTEVSPLDSQEVSLTQLVLV